VVIDAAGSGQIVIPGGQLSGGSFLMSAHYEREGQDLLLRGPGGDQVIVRDYFASDAPPDLLTELGARIPADLVAILAGPEAAGQYAQGEVAETPEDVRAPIGRIEVADGTVSAQRSDGTSVNLAVGDPVYQGDLIETGPEAAVSITFVDASSFSLSGDGRLALDELVFDPDAESGSSKFSVVQGVFSFVSGQISHSGPDAMVISTPVANIGIRGTKGAGVVTSEGQLDSITLLSEPGGQVGEIVVFNAVGSLVLNRANETTSVIDVNLPPTPTVVLPAAEIEARYGNALARLPQPPEPPQPEGQAANDGAADEGEQIAENDEGEEGEADDAETEEESETTVAGDEGDFPAAPPPPAADPFGAGPLGAGPLGAGPLGAGPLGAGPLGTGPLGAGPLQGPLPGFGARPGGPLPPTGPFPPAGPLPTLAPPPAAEPHTDICSGFKR
jgi:hypothetical protein